MNIPLVDLSAQYRPLKQAILQQVERILDGMHLFLGPNVQAFEGEFAAFQEVGHAIGVSDGTSALQLALTALGIGPGDEVITVSHTFIATAEAIVLVGARPVFVDIDPATYTMDVARIEERISPHTRAIVPVHLYGQPADMDPIVSIAQRHNLRVIEDACQAHGARYKGRRTGGLGHAAAYSFYFSKNLGAYGEAGMVTTNDESLARMVRMLRDHGSCQRYHHDVVGMKVTRGWTRSRLPCSGYAFPYLEMWNAQRQANAIRYGELLSGIAGVTVPSQASYAEHVYHLYVVRVPHRDALKQYLWDKHGIGTGITSPIPCHMQPALSSLGYKRGNIPGDRAVRWWATFLSDVPGAYGRPARYVAEMPFERSIIMIRPVCDMKEWGCCME